MRVRFALSIVAAVVVLGAVRAEAQVVTLAEAAREAAGRTGSGTLSGVVTLPPGVSVDVVVIRLRTPSPVKFSGRRLPDPTASSRSRGWMGWRSRSTSLRSSTRAASS